MASPALDMTVRRPTKDDLDSMIEVVERTWAVSNDEDLPDSTISDLTADQSISELINSRIDEFWIAIQDGQLKGVLGADRNGYIWALYVLPEHQRMGIGSALLAKTIDHFRARGLTSLFLDIIDTNKTAQQFYLAHGWKIDGHRKESLPGHTATAIRYFYII